MWAYIGLLKVTVVAITFFHSSHRFGLTMKLGPAESVRHSSIAARQMLLSASLSDTSWQLDQRRSSACTRMSTLSTLYGDFWSPLNCRTNRSPASALLPFASFQSVVKVVLWSRGAHLTKPRWSKPHTHSNPTNLALFRHKMTLYRFTQGAHAIAGGLKWEQGGWAPPPAPSL